MEHEPTLTEALKYRAVNVALGVCYFIILAAPPIFYVMTP